MKEDKWNQQAILCVNNLELIQYEQNLQCTTSLTQLVTIGSYLNFYFYSFQSVQVMYVERFETIKEFCEYSSIETELWTRFTQMFWCIYSITCSELLKKTHIKCHENDKVQSKIACVPQLCAETPQNTIGNSLGHYEHFFKFSKEMVMLDV